MNNSKVKLNYNFIFLLKNVKKYRKVFDQTYKYFRFDCFASIFYLSFHDGMLGLIHVIFSFWDFFFHFCI